MKKQKKEKSLTELIREHNKKVSEGAVKWVNKHKPKKSPNASPNYSGVTITKHHNHTDYFA